MLNVRTPVMAVSPVKNCYKVYGRAITIGSDLWSGYGRQHHKVSRRDILHSRVVKLVAELQVCRHDDRNVRYAVPLRRVC